MGTADQSERKQLAAPMGKSYPLLDKIVVLVGMAVLALGLLLLIYMFATSHNEARKPRGTTTVKRTHAPRWIPPQGVVVRRISWNHYKADDGKLIVTDECLEPAENVTAILQYDAHDPDADDLLTFPSGDTCRVLSVGT